MLTIGSRFGSYEVLSSLGQGGMGEVYRVRDTKLGRDVAIKIVSDGFGHDPERLARFQREAHLLASLNHPHIAAIYGLEESNGSQFLVLELVEGGTLAQRLKSRPLPVPEALSVARQIADALQAAHEKGIIHRDLKPANIAFTVDGQVKVLDFGLAKAVESESMADVANSPTMTLGGTQAGVILGTAPYMAPEQAKGRPADKRSDIWALGCVLYEMLTGKRAFEGEDVSDTLAFVITKEPEWSALPADVPPAIRKVLRRCLEKDRKRRFADIADVRLDIEDALNAVPDATAAVIAPPAGRSNRRLIAIGSLAAAAVIAIAFWSGQRRASPSPPAPVARFLVNVAPAEQLLAAPEDRDTVEGRPSRTSMTWSVDGRSIVFSAAEGDRQQLYIRTIDRLVATPLPGTQGGAIPFVSPDGRWVGFWSSGALKKVPIDGSGPATTICETTLLPYGATWGADDAIIFSRGTEGLWRVPATGGTAQAIIKPDLTKGEWKFLSPQLLPGDGAVVFTVTHTGFPTWEDDTEVVVHVFATGERKVLVHGGADGRVLPTGQLLYLRRGTLMAVAFDLEQVAATGGPVALIADVMQSANTPNDAFEGGAGQFSVSATGSLLYAPGGTFPPPERSLAWVDRNGTAEPLPLASRPYASPRLSPDGRRLLVWTQGDRNVWVHDLSRGVTTRLTFEGRNARAIWTPDGTRITYASTVAGAENLFWRPSDGSGTTERLAPSEGYQAPGVWTPDGRTLLFIQENPTTPLDIWTLSLDGDRRPQPFLQTSYDEEYVDLSPDGRWLAYVSNQSGRGEVYVQPYPGPGARQQISLDGGTAPAWSRDGRELFYTTTSSVGGQATLTTMMVVPVQLQPTFTAGTPRRLFQGRYGATANIRAYDVTSDGRRFLMVQQKERPAMRLADMIIVQNWVEELRQKARPK